MPAEATGLVTKVRHSVFYSTPLAYLLAQLGIERLVLTGQVTEQCIRYSAPDATCVISKWWCPSMRSLTSTPS